MLGRRLSLAEISAHNFRGWPYQVSVSVKAYYDASGMQSDEYFTLAGYGATPKCWEAFEDDWWKTLDAAPIRCRYLRMSEANALQGEFWIGKGWNRQKVRDLLTALFNECFSPFGPGRPDVAKKLIGASCSVRMADYREACERVQGFAESMDPSVLCLEHVLNVVGAQYQALKSGEGSIELYFDQNEPFYPHIDSAYRNREDRFSGNPVGPLGSVSGISERDMREVAALQAADYLAWHTNRWLTKESQEMYLLLQLSAQTLETVYGYDDLIGLYENRIHP